jgi:cytochrome c
MNKGFVAAAMSALVFAAGAARAADPVAGERVFKAQCGACHSADAGRTRVGPSLFGIVGRAAGAVEGFRYSPGNKAAKITWDEATLGRYLVDPKAMIPATSMTYAGLRNDAQREDLVAYLATLK